MAVLLYAAYLLSGFCALIYENVWIYRFSRIFGSTVFAMSFVVAMFFAGLALGAHWLGRISSRSPNPLRLYAQLELAIGGYALAFPLIIALTEKVYAGVYPSIAGSFAAITLVRMLLAFVVMFPPAVLMGGTLPVLLTHFADRMATLGSRAGLVYGLNALGAALGSFLSGYALLEMLGVSKTNAVAALLNLAIGCLAWALSRRLGTERDARTTERSMGVPPMFGTARNAPTAANAKEEEQPVAQESPAIVALVTCCFAVSGFVSMSYEVTWLRYLSFYFHETIYLYAGIITVFVLGIGLGSLLCGYAVARIKHLVAFFGLLQAGIGLLTLLAVYVPLRFFQPIYDAGVASAANVLLILLALLTAPAALMGATFPVVTKIIVPSLRDVGSKVGRAYALNTLCGILGLLCSGFVLHNYLGLQMSLYILFGMNMALAAVLLAADRSLARPYLAASPLTALAVAVIVIQCWNLQLPRAVMRTRVRPNVEVLEVREGVVDIAWATKARGGNEVHLWGNGVRIGRGGRSTFLAQGYIPILLAPRIPRNVLGLAFGAGLSYRAARLFPEVQRLDFVDISKDNMDVALRRFPENDGLADDRRARFIVDDAYSYVKYNAATYDLLLMEPTPPRFSYQSASLYTKEFYELVRRRLTDGGYFAQVLSLNDFSPEETVSVMRTFSSVFEHCLLWRNGWDFLMIGCGQEFHLDVQSIGERLNRPLIQKTLRQCAPLSDKYYILDNFISGCLLAEDDFRKAAAGGTLYTDDNAGLRFTTGRNVTTENIRNIHAHLTPWREIRRLFDRYPDFEKKEPLLTVKREFLMALLFQHKPREFPAVFMNYVEKFSPRKDADLELLHSYLLKHGMTDKAEEVETMLEAMEETPQDR
ncbi:MAG: fused MFS/spermidine synthase [Planctomycetota bacterium]|nr:fused MFS/spermidine synthase [Planctomycetota bacterium]